MGHKRFNDTNDNLDDLADELGLPIAQMANFIVDNDSDKVLQTMRPENLKSEEKEYIRRIINDKSGSYLYEKIRIKRQ